MPASTSDSPTCRPGEAASAGGFLRSESVTPDLVEKARRLNEVARERGQTLAQMALAWTLRDPRVTSTLIGASSVAQLEQNVAALEHLDFSPEELAEIDRYATESGVNIWAKSSAD